ncbi:MAG TPA: NfeD family protein [Burkholderiales bacterium]|nr:NfeD family protein [Burkholderiales bacterium]
MCHFLLLLPVVALPVWWLLPLGEAAAVYAVVLVATAVMFGLAVKAMRAPVITGAAPLRGATGTVRRAEGRRGAVWVASELWSATSADGPLAVGDEIEVVGIDGLTLQVRKLLARAEARSPADPAQA